MASRFFPGTPGKRFVPSNGVEYMHFSAIFCEQCQKDTNEDCEILLAAMVFDPKGSDYPDEWVYGSDRQPVCNAFERVDQ